MSRQDQGQRDGAQRLSRRRFLQAGVAVGSGLALAACGGAPSTADTATTGGSAAAASSTAAGSTAGSSAVPSGAASGSTAALDALIAGARQEGQLSVIALPDDWSNYAEMKATFKEKYPFITLNDLNPQGSSGDEIEAIKANKDNKGPQAPDVIDVGFSFGPSAKTEGLIQPYKVATWDTIPAALKDPDGYWYGDYYGVMAFEVNTDVIQNVPQDWADLLKPEYKGQVALAGDPRKAAQAINAVWAAALANGGSADDAMPGLDFFAKLNQAGNFVPVIATGATVAQGETPIALRWDYNALGNRDNLKDNPKLEVVVPRSGVLAGVYVQAISAFAPHPNAAKLWMEHLYSDQGQLIWLKGYSHPVRYDDLVKRNLVPTDLAAKLPPAELYAKAAFPTLDQITKATKAITENWNAMVGADVK